MGIFLLHFYIFNSDILLGVETECSDDCHCDLRAVKVFGKVKVENSTRAGETPAGGRKVSAAGQQG
jgi:hypothetical protein